VFCYVNCLFQFPKNSINYSTKILLQLRSNSHSKICNHKSQKDRISISVECCGMDPPKKIIKNAYDGVGATNFSTLPGPGYRSNFDQKRKGSDYLISGVLFIHIYSIRV